MSHDLGPFFQAKAATNDALVAAVGVDRADTWVKKMIAHRQGTIHLTRVLLDEKGAPAHIAATAAEILHQQTGAITELTALAKAGSADDDSALLYAAALSRMHDETMSALGATAAESWMLKVLAHYRGGLALTDLLLEGPSVPPRTRALALETRGEFQAQIARLSRMTTQGTMPESASTHR